MPSDTATTIAVSIPDETKSGLTRAFGPFKTKKEEQDAILRFANLAVSALSDWLTGNKRYRSLTEQYIDWVEQVYTDLLPQEEAPSTERIYNSLNMPYGQAAYISRVLASKTLVHWRTIAAKELRDALKDAEKNARQYVKDGDQGQGVNIQVSQVAVHELIRVCSTRRRSDRSYLMPQPGASSGDFRFVSIPACTIVDLIDKPNW
jgi:hypothetical protein